MYYLAPSGAAGDAEELERAFVREELMNIPEDTQVPPDLMKKW